MKSTILNGPRRPKASVLILTGVLPRIAVGHKVLHRSNQMYELKHFGMVWQRRTRRKCCGAQRKPISSPFEKFAKGLEKYRK
jgi:hypothetical protein